MSLARETFKRSFLPETDDLRSSNNFRLPASLSSHSSCLQSIERTRSEQWLRADHQGAFNVCTNLRILSLDVNSRILADTLPHIQKARISQKMLIQHRRCRLPVHQQRKSSLLILSRVLLRGRNDPPAVGQSLLRYLNFLTYSRFLKRLLAVQHANPLVFSGTHTYLQDTTEAPSTRFNLPDPPIQLLENSFPAHSPSPASNRPTTQPSPPIFKH